MHELDRRFKDFADYCAALTSHYRYDIRRSERKFRASGFRVAQLHDADEIRVSTLPRPIASTRPSWPNPR